MACIYGEFPEEDDRRRQSSSIGDALLFATMCIIGLPVEVHVRDGSIFSGIFHTCFAENNNYDVVLKNAVLTKTGKDTASLLDWGLIGTLVICSEDLVQVVAKGVQFGADHDLGDVRSNDSDGFGVTVPLSGCPGKEEKSEELNLSPTDEKRNQSNKVADGMPQGEPDGYKQPCQNHEEENSTKLETGSVNFDFSSSPKKLVDNTQANMASTMFPDVLLSGEIATSDGLVDGEHCERNASATIPPSNANSPAVMNFFTSVADHVHPSGPCHNSPETSSKMAPAQSSTTNRNAKESKLNPEAEIFSPTIANVRTSTPAVPIATTAFLPNTFPLVSVDAVETEMEMNPFASHTSLPVKFVPCSNLMAGNGGSSLQYNQSIMGYPGGRMQHAARNTNQFRPVQVAPAFVPPTPQAVMVGRLGQVVYVHPVSQEAVQSTAAMSPAPARPVFMPQQVQFPKHQGYVTAQVCAPPFVTGGQQPVVVPNPVQLLQPSFLANRPIAVPGPSTLLSSKFS